MVMVEVNKSCRVTCALPAADTIRSRRISNDSVWPLRGADGKPFYKRLARTIGKD